MCEAFRAHFRDRFARCPGLPVQEFCSYLADFPRLLEVEATSCEGLITECREDPDLCSPFLSQVFKGAVPS